MTLENKQQLKKAVFNILKSVYNINSDGPKSDKQEEFVNELTDYVYDNMEAREVGALPIPHADKFRATVDEDMNKIMKVIEEGEVAVKKGRGRPKGAKNK